VTIDGGDYKVTDTTVEFPHVGFYHVSMLLGYVDRYVHTLAEMAPALYNLIQGHYTFERGGNGYYTFQALIFIDTAAHCIINMVATVHAALTQLDYLVMNIFAEDSPRADFSAWNVSHQHIGHYSFTTGGGWLFNTATKLITNSAATITGNTDTIYLAAGLYFIDIHQSGAAGVTTLNAADTDCTSTLLTKFANGAGTAAEYICYVVVPGPDAGYVTFSNEGGTTSGSIYITPFALDY